MKMMMRRRRHDDVRWRHGRTVRDPVSGRLRGPTAKLTGGAADVHVTAIWVDHPVVSFAGVVKAARDLNEALVQRQVVPNAVLPRGRVHPVKRKLVHDVFVDAAERESLLGALRNGHHDQSVVAVVRLLVFFVHHGVLGGGRLAVLSGTVLWAVHVGDGLSVVGRGRRLIATVVRRRWRRATARPRAVVDGRAQAIVATAVTSLAAGGKRPRGRRHGTLTVGVPLVFHVQMAQDVVDGECRPAERFGDHFDGVNERGARELESRKREEHTGIADNVRYARVMCFRSGSERAAVTKRKKIL